MTPSDTLSTSSTVVTWMARGVVAGIAVPTLWLAPEVVSRIAHAASGRGGGSALWDEPLFYMVMLSLPAGLAGLATGTVLGLGHGWWKRSARSVVASRRRVEPARRQQLAHRAEAS
jgi:hypothetical protein